MLCLHRYFFRQNCQGGAKRDFLTFRGLVSAVFIFANDNEKKNRLRNSLRDTNLSHLMKIVIESPQTLSDEELEQIVDICLPFICCMS